MADEVLSVDFLMMGVDDGMKEIAAISKAIAKLPKQVKISIEVVTKNIVRDMKQAAGGVSRSVKEWKSSGSSKSTPPGPTYGENQARSFNRAGLHRGIADYAKAEARRKYGGTGKPLPNSAFDLGQRVRSGKGGGDPFGVGSTASGNSGFGKALKNAIFSTRFTLNNGHPHFSPLIGRSMQALAQAGPIGIAAGAAAVGLVMLHAAADKAAQKMSEFESGRFMAGGSAAEMSRAQHLGGAVGIDNPAAMAREFADALKSDDFTRWAASAIGISNPMGSRGPGSKLDVLPDFFKAAKAIANAPSNDAAMRMARDLGHGMEQFMSLRDMSPMHRDRALKEMEEMNSDEGRQAAADYRESMSHLSYSMTKLGNALVPVIELFGGLMDFASNLLPKLNDKGANSFMNPGQHGKSGQYGPGGNLRAGKDRQNAEDRHTTALDRNTDAIWAQVRSARQLFGGGERAGGAMPSHLRGQTFREGLRAHAVGMGAFGV